MSERRKLQQRLRQLKDIRDIMDAMKNLAMAEIFKLKPGLENQRQMVSDLERMATDYLGYYPFTYPGDGDAVEIWILFGSERGFCGDFNNALIKSLEQRSQAGVSVQTYLILIGDKLSRRFEDKEEYTRAVDGADVAEEVTAMLNNIVACLEQLHGQFHSVHVHALYHDADTGLVTRKQLLPPFKELTFCPTQHGVPPLLHVPPAEFFPLLVDEYLYFSLHEIAYLSLLAENNKRIQHMTGALQHLDQRTGELTRKYHFHRQEEITEEIEVILLNTTNI